MIDSLELHTLMREAGVDQSVIDAACKVNNAISQRAQKEETEERSRRERLERAEARLAADRDEAIEALLASKPKLKRWVGEEDDGRRAAFGYVWVSVGN